MAQYQGATAGTVDACVRRIRAGRQTAAEAADQLIAELTEDELLWLLDGDTPIQAALKLMSRMKAGPVVGGAVARLGIPGIRFSDGPRGVIMGHSTAFPVTMARAATWDPALEREVGTAIGLEARAQGANYSAAVCVNLLRHPAWGRAQECYGEDPVLTGRMGVALTRGLRPHVMACVKHFALNSVENSRFKVDVTVDEHALHEVYLPHFRAVVAAGVDSVMSSYNSVNGRFLDVNKVLLTDVLRDEWGFEGFVTSDWVFGVHDAVGSLEAGLDVEMPLRLVRARGLPAAREDGRLPHHLVVRSAHRVLRTTLAHLATREQAEPSLEVVASPAHRALARRAATRAMVLLKNDPVGAAAILPLDASIGRLAVIGRLAAEANIGDHGSSMVDPPSTSAPLDGLRAALPGIEISHLDGSHIAAAAEAAARADAAILVVGMDHRDEGERIQNDDADLSVLGFPFTLRPVRRVIGWLVRTRSQFGRGGDRATLTLHASDERLITAVAAANPRTAVVLIGGSALIVEAWRERVPAILHAWYPGMEGGRALADVLTGAAEPGGRLPVAIPTDPAHLPFFDAEARTITYDAWWGQRKLDRDGHPAAFPFGFGLGYTTFEHALVDQRVGETDGTATVRVRNTGARVGSTVAQVYAVDTALERPVPRLVGFRRVDLDAGGEVTLDVALDLTPIRQRDPRTRLWSRRPGSWGILVAAHSPSVFDDVAPLAAPGA
ncbi:glycoside hydrolase family 3 C-terminal domain-containing protein [Frankia sp. Ag45/Mut15]|uniref:Glycoside hydrolase family 3 C-terminal domain-containing protein n=1 Tax=Frankia umida TaxID=573489 RepID=A0ABT0K6H9_9ACTN|nr:glycoside hydrolase family 3 C-terminal domain-containing protein [Frankia umida]MCK9878928.1 glycoside hydrolase family 3 C-terminal domain-containing protein [Frankia umida]